MKRKVCCKKCIYIYKGTVEKCFHPDNIIKDGKFEKRYIEKSYKRTPEKINAKNDCVWFVEQEWEVP